MRGELLGPVGSASREVLLFVSVGIGRSMIIWLNGVAVGVSQVAFESSARQKICQWAIGGKEVASGRVATLFNDIVVCAGAATTRRIIFSAGC